jgi:hypothetical protein
MTNTQTGSNVEDCHDLERPRVDHDDLVADEEVLISTPAGIDLHEFAKHRIEMNGAWHPGADRDREVDVRRRLHVLLLDDGADRGALLGREIRRRSSRSLTGGRGLGIAGLFRTRRARALTGGRGLGIAGLVRTLGARALTGGRRLGIAGLLRASFLLFMAGTLPVMTKTQSHQ